MKKILSILLIMLTVGFTAPLDCQALNNPGWTYNMTADTTLNYTNQGGTDTCFGIMANNIILDCAGYTIDGNDTASTYGIYINEPAGSILNNITIQNCAVTDYKDGIKFEDVENSTITGNNASSNNERGMKIQDSNNILIYNNRVFDFKNSGIGLEHCLNLSIYDNTFYDAAAGGMGITISIADANNTNIYNNLIENLTLGGFNAAVVSSNIPSNASIYSNTIRNATFGIFSAIAADDITSTTNTITNCTIGIQSGYSAMGLVGRLTSTTDNITNSGTVDVVADNASYVYLRNTVIDNALNLTADIYSANLTRLASGAAAPSGYAGISKFLTMTNTSANSWAYVNITYTAAEAAAVTAESTLRLWRYTGGAWTTALGTATSGVNTTSNYVYGNVSNFASTFGVFGTAPAVADTTPTAGPPSIPLMKPLGKSSKIPKIEVIPSEQPGLEQEGLEGEAGEDIDGTRLAELGDISWLLWTVGIIFVLVVLGFVFLRKK